MAALQILIVDDYPQVREDLRKALGLFGNLEVIGEAADGLQAVSLTQELQPQVVVMDLEMPVMDGYEATRQIKSIAPGCRVVALSIHSYAAAREKALQAGVDFFVEKGAALDILVKALSGDSTPCRSRSE